MKSYFFILFLFFSITCFGQIAKDLIPDPLKEKSEIFLSKQIRKYYGKEMAKKYHNFLIIYDLVRIDGASFPLDLSSPSPEVLQMDSLIAEGKCLTDYYKAYERAPIFYFLAYDDSLNIKFSGDYRRPFLYHGDMRPNDQNQRFVSYIKRKPKLIFKNLIGPLDIIYLILENDSIVKASF